MESSDGYTASTGSDAKTSKVKGKKLKLSLMRTDNVSVKMHANYQQFTALLLALMHLKFNLELLSILLA